MKLKKILALGAVAALALGLGACGDASDSEIAKKSDNKMQVFQFDGIRTGNNVVSFPVDTPVKLETPKEILEVLPDDFVQKHASVNSYVVQNRKVSALNCVFEVEVDYVEEAKNQVFEQFDEKISSDAIKQVESIPADDDLELNKTYITNDYKTLVGPHVCGKEYNNRAIDDHGYGVFDVKGRPGLAGVDFSIKLNESGGMDIGAGLGAGLKLSTTGKWQFDPESVKS